MRFGLTLGVDVPAPDELVRIVRKAEALGFASFYVGDHVIIPRAVDEEAHRREVGGNVDFADKTGVNVFDPFLTLSYLAARVDHIRLGFSILVLPYRNPVMTAKMLSTLDVHCGGRLDVGVGAGWIKEEFDALGVSYEHRGRITDESIQIFVELWTAEYPAFHGEFFEFSNVAFLPKPVQQPRIPILIGGNGPRALRRVANVGDGWLPLFLTPEELTARRRQLTQFCEAQGREIAELTVKPSCRIRLGSTDEAGVRAPLTGSPEQVRNDLRQYEEAGANEIILVIVESDLNLNRLEETLEWFSAIAKN